MTAAQLCLYKVRGGWWRLNVHRKGEHLWVVILGTRDEKLAQDKLARYRKVEETLAAKPSLYA